MVSLTLLPLLLLALSNHYSKFAVTFIMFISINIVVVVVIIIIRIKIIIIIEVMISAFLIGILSIIATTHELSK